MDEESVNNGGPVGGCVKAASYENTRVQTACKYQNQKTSM